MLDLERNVIVPDSKIWFYDGFLWIISADDNITEGTASCELIILDPEFDAPICLSEITEKYPDVKKILFNGVLYNYNNHLNGEKWELVGKTIGYV